MAGKLFVRLLLFLSVLICAVDVSAQFVPGKKPGAGAAVEYKKVAAGDSARVRKSRLGSKKRNSSVKSEKGSVKKLKTGGRSSVKRSSSKVVPSKKRVGNVASPKVDSLRYEPVKYRLGDRMIMRGDSGADVRNVARILVKKLYIGEDSIIYTKDGGVLYDGDLVRAVKHFQEFNGLYPDGIISSEVVKALRRRK